MLPGIQEGKERVVKGVVGGVCCASWEEDKRKILSCWCHMRPAVARTHRPTRLANAATHQRLRSILRSHIVENGVVSTHFTSSSWGRLVTDGIASPPNTGPLGAYIDGRIPHHLQVIPRFACESFSGGRFHRRNLSASRFKN